MRSSTSSTALSHDLEPPERFPFLPGLDGLRAVAIMAVLFYYADFTWAQGGFLGVEVFFVISGYLITSLLVVEWLRTGTVDLKAFWLRRAKRLLPAVFLLLGVVAIGSILFLRETLYRLGTDILAASTYVSNWFFILRQDSYFETFGRPPLLRHLWSLSVEEQFYVLWPILFSVGLAIVGGKAKHATIKRFSLLVATGAVGSTLLMAMLFTPFEDPSRLYYGTDTRASGILIGVALALWWMPWRLPTVVSARYKVGLRIIGFAALAGVGAILVGLNEFSPWLYRGGFAVTSLLTATVIAVIAHPAGGFGVLFSNPVMRWIGTRSYGIYLWFFPIFMVTRPGVDVGWNPTTTFVVRLVITFAVAELSYRFVETPIRTIGYRKWMRNITARLGVATPRAATGIAIAWLVSIAIVASILIAGTGTNPPSEIIASPSGDTVTEAATEDTGQDPVSQVTSAADQPTEAESEHDDPGGAADSSETATTTVAVPSGVTPPSSLTPDAEPSDAPTNATSDTEIGVTLIGDSVLAGAANEVISKLGPQTVVDATVSRQFKDADDVISGLRAQGKLGDVVVIHLGTNGAFNSTTFDETMQAMSGVDRVIVLTVFVPKRWESVVNAAIASGKERWPEVEVIDYNAFGKDHPEYFNKDGVHLNSTGQSAYATFLDEAIRGVH